VERRRDQLLVIGILNVFGLWRTTAIYWLSRTGINEKPSNQAPISRFSSQMTGNL
jgi:hypothetical protein